MQFTAAVLAAAMAMSASAATVPSTPAQPHCLADVVQRPRIILADCRAAIKDLRQPFDSGFGVGCDKVFQSDFQWAASGTCVIRAKAEGGDAHCADPWVVADAAEAIIKQCRGKGSWNRYTSLGEVDIGKGVKVVVTASASADDGPQ